MRYFYLAKCSRVIDGDTIEVNIDLGFGINKKEIVRLYGIDAPEISSKNETEKAAATVVKLYVKSLIEEKHIFLNTVKFDDKFGRYLGSVSLDELMTINLCEDLLSKKFVKTYNGSRKKPWLEEELKNIVNIKINE